MADYDVGVIALTTPAATAPLTPTRPVVSVRNNGLYDAVASGYIRIYSAGRLVFESEVWSDTLAPGATGSASSVKYWTPEAEGPYMVYGHITTPLDQVESNNNLAPTAVQISGEAPPPPMVIPIHASQHENGGSDEISIEGLLGRAHDPQPPFAHASNHQPGGADILEVTGLEGVLADPQTPKAHATTHRSTGDDVLNVDHLAGITNLERVARKGQQAGYCELDISSAIPVVRLAPVTPSGDGEYRLRFVQPSGARDWVEHIASASVTSAIEGAHYFTPPFGLQELIRLALTEAQAKPGTAGIFDLSGSILTAVGAGQSVDIVLGYQEPAGFIQLLALSIPVASGVNYFLTGHLSCGMQPLRVLSGTAHVVVDVPGTPVPDQHFIGWSPSPLVSVGGAGFFKVLIGWTGGVPGSIVNIYASTGHGVILP